MSGLALSFNAPEPLPSRSLNATPALDMNSSFLWRARCHAATVLAVDTRDEIVVDRNTQPKIL